MCPPLAASAASHQGRETCATHSAALCVVGSVGQDERAGLQGTVAAPRAGGPVRTAGQDQEEMCRDGGLIPGGKGDQKWLNPYLNSTKKKPQTFTSMKLFPKDN